MSSFRFEIEDLENAGHAQRLLDCLAGLQDVREEGAGSQLGDIEVEHAELASEVAVAVALGLANARAFVLARAD